MDSRIPLSDESIRALHNYGSINSSFGDNKNDSQSKIGFFSILAQRLRYRKDLFIYRRLFSTYSFIFGFVGLIISIIITEIEIYHAHYEKPLNYIYILLLLFKIMVTISTLILITCIFIYNYMDFKIEMIKHNLNDWKLVIDIRKIIKVIFEFCVCIIHPIPVMHDDLYDDKSNKETLIYWIHIDGMLTLIMFLRFYLLARLFVLKTKLYHNATAQTFGAINRTALNSKFLCKSWLNLYSGYVLSVITLIIVLWGSWSYRICEWNPQFEYYVSFTSSLYFTAITFISIGYGDFIPMTVCGKIGAVVTAALGAGCLALTVAIISRKLDLSNSEKHLHRFMKTYHLDEKIRHISATIIKLSWLIYKYRALKHYSANSQRVIQVRRQLLYQIRQIQAIRKERSHMDTDSLSFQEVNHLQSQSKVILYELNENIEQVENRLIRICDKLLITKRTSRINI